MLKKRLLEIREVMGLRDSSVRALHWAIDHLFLLEKYVSLFHHFCYFNHHRAANSRRFWPPLAQESSSQRSLRCFSACSDRKLAVELAPGSEPGPAFGTVFRPSILPPSAPESCWQLWKQKNEPVEAVGTEVQHISKQKDKLLVDPIPLKDWEL